MLIDFIENASSRRFFGGPRSSVTTSNSPSAITWRNFGGLGEFSSKSQLRGWEERKHLLEGRAAKFRCGLGTAGRSTVDAESGLVSCARGAGQRIAGDLEVSRRRDLRIS